MRTHIIFCGAVSFLAIMVSSRSLPNCQKVPQGDQCNLTRQCPSGVSCISGRCSTKEASTRSSLLESKKNNSFFFKDFEGLWDEPEEPTSETDTEELENFWDEQEEQTSETDTEEYDDTGDEMEEATFPKESIFGGQTLEEKRETGRGNRKNKVERMSFMNQCLGIHQGVNCEKTERCPRGWMCILGRCLAKEPSLGSSLLESKKSNIGEFEGSWDEPEEFTSELDTEKYDSAGNETQKPTYPIKFNFSGQNSKEKRENEMESGKNKGELMSLMNQRLLILKGVNCETTKRCPRGWMCILGRCFNQKPSPGSSLLESKTNNSEELKGFSDELEESTHPIEFSFSGENSEEEIEKKIGRSKNKVELMSLMSQRFGIFQGDDCETTKRCPRGWMCIFGRCFAKESSPGSSLSQSKKNDTKQFKGPWDKPEEPTSEGDTEEFDDRGDETEEPTYPIEFNFGGQNLEEKIGKEMGSRKTKVELMSLMSQRLRILKGANCETTKRCPRGWLCILGRCFTKEPSHGSSLRKLKKNNTEKLGGHWNEQEEPISEHDTEEYDGQRDETEEPTYPIEFSFGGQNSKEVRENEMGSMKNKVELMSLMSQRLGMLKKANCKTTKRCPRGWLCVLGRCFTQKSSSGSSLLESKKNNTEELGGRWDKLVEPTSKTDTEEYYGPGDGTQDPTYPIKFRVDRHAKELKGSSDELEESTHPIEFSFSGQNSEEEIEKEMGRSKNKVELMSLMSQRFGILQGDSCETTKRCPRGWMCIFGRCFAKESSTGSSLPQSKKNDTKQFKGPWDKPEEPTSEGDTEEFDDRGDETEEPTYPIEFNFGGQNLEDKIGKEMGSRKNKLKLMSLMSQRLGMLKGANCETTKRCPRGWLCIFGRCFFKESFPGSSLPQSKKNDTKQFKGPWDKPDEPTSEGDTEEYDGQGDKTEEPIYPIEFSFGEKKSKEIREKEMENMKKKEELMSLISQHFGMLQGANCETTKRCPRGWMCILGRRFTKESPLGSSIPVSKKNNTGLFKGPWDETEKPTYPIDFNFDGQNLKEKREKKMGNIRNKAELMSLIIQRLRMLQGANCETTKRCPRGWMCVLGTCLSKEDFPGPSLPEPKTTNPAKFGGPCDKRQKHHYPIEINFERQTVKLFLSLPDILKVVSVINDS